MFEFSLQKKYYLRGRFWRINYEKTAFIISEVFLFGNAKKWLLFNGKSSPFCQTLIKLYIFFSFFRIGVNGFENPMRDPKTEEFKSQIGQGAKVKMDETGNILVKRFSKAGVYVKNTIEENSVSNDILKLPNGLLEPEKPFKLFDMKKFQQNVNR